MSTTKPFALSSRRLRSFLSPWRSRATHSARFLLRPCRRNHRRDQRRGTCSPSHPRPPHPQIPHGSTGPLKSSCGSHGVSADLALFEVCGPWRHQTKNRADESGRYPLVAHSRRQPVEHARERNCFAHAVESGARSRSPVHGPCPFPRQSRPSRWRVSAINLFAVGDAQNHVNRALILNLADGAVVADAISPFSSLPDRRGSRSPATRS